MCKDIFYKALIHVPVPDWNVFGLICNYFEGAMNGYNKNNFFLGGSVLTSVLEKIKDLFSSSFIIPLLQFILYVVWQYQTYSNNIIYEL